MKLRKADKEALRVARDGRPIYRCGDGPHVMRPDGFWLKVPMTTIERLERAGLLSRVEVEGWVAYWLVTDDGRAIGILRAT